VDGRTQPPQWCSRPGRPASVVNIGDQVQLMLLSKSYAKVRQLDQQKKYYFKPEFASPQYSESFLEWSAQEHSKDPDFFAGARVAHQSNRVQLDFACDVRLVARLKLLARYLDTPCYLLAEHALEVGLGEVRASIEDRALTELLQRHLLERHLLVGELGPVPTATSARAARIERAMELLDLVDRQGGSFAVREAEKGKER